VKQQRVIGEQGDIIMVGRDIGTVVLPDADLKVFLTASTEVRAKRRWQEMRDQGQDVDLRQVLQETKARDDLDTLRADSPLFPAVDALQVDTDVISAEQVVEELLAHIRRLSQSDLS
jgi:cytidylate kinase